MVATPRHDGHEPLSPELVLVSDAEEARRAREELPEAPGARAAGPFSRAAAAFARADTESQLMPRQRTLPPAYPRVRLEDLAPPPGARRREPKNALFLLVPVAIALAVGGYFAARRLHENHGTTAQVVQTAPITLSASPPVASPELGGTQQTGASPRAAFIPRGSFLATRVFRWAPQHAARRYDVTFFWNGRVVLNARPRQPRLALPPTFRFHAGRYRWIVRVTPRKNNGTPVVDSTFVLTKVAAAAANRG
jgi:hypothetical protein